MPTVAQGVLTPKQVAVRAWLDARSADLATSSDLRLRILYTNRAIARRNARTSMRSDAPPVDLLEWSRGSTDPLVLDLVLRGCEPFSEKPTCDIVAIARRWVAVDAQNQLAWLALAATLDNRRDSDGADDALRRAAQAPQWHEHAQDIVELVARSIPGTATVQQRNAALREAVSMSVAGYPLLESIVLGKRCRNVAVLDACRRIADTMARDSTTAFGLSWSARIADWSGSPDWIVEAYDRKHDAVEWAIESRLSEQPDPYADLDDAAARIVDATLEARVARGERADAERWLQERHIDEADAARRYIATLPPDMASTYAQIHARSGRVAREPDALSAGSTRSTAASP